MNESFVSFCKRMADIAAEVYPGLDKNEFRFEVRHVIDRNTGCDMYIARMFYTDQKHSIVSAAAAATEQKACDTLHCELYKRRKVAVPY